MKVNEVSVVKSENLTIKIEYDIILRNKNEE